MKILKKSKDTYKRKIINILIDFFRLNILWLIWLLLITLSYSIKKDYSFLAWVSYTPLLWAAYNNSPVRVIKYAFIYYSLHLLLIYYWLFAFWFPSPFLIIPIYSIIFSFFIFMISVISKKYKNIRWILTTLLLLINEIYRMYGFHALPWNFIGMTQWRNTIVIQSADITGIIGISFMIYLMNSVLVEILFSYKKEEDIVLSLFKNKVKILILLIILIVNMIYGTFAYRYYKYIDNNSRKMKVSMIQANIGSFEPWYIDRWKYYGLIWKLSAEAALQKPDLIIFSESQVREFVWYYWYYFPHDTEDYKYAERFLYLSEELNTPLLLTCPDYDIENKRIYNSAFYIDREIKKDKYNAKIHLVPFGEWLPLYDRVPIIKKIMEFEGAGSFKPSNEESLIDNGIAKFRVLVCFEDIFANLARRFVFKGANYFINVTNDGWAYRLGFKTPHYQHLAAAVFTAISLRRPIARAGNSGCTGILNILGEYKSNFVDYDTDIFTGDISIIDNNLITFYASFGYLFPYIILFITVLIFMILFIKENAYAK